jgi:hypothetical protein
VSARLHLAGAVLGLALAGWMVSGFAAAESGRTIELRPASADTSCEEEFVAVARTLRPGDELVLRGGVYSQSCQRRIRDIHGTPDRPIVIRAAVGETPILTRPRGGNGEYGQNNLEVANVSHLVLRGLTLKGGSSGLRFMGRATHVTVEDSEIHGTDNNAITMNSGDTDGFVIRRNHIHHTGLLPDAAGGTEGEGLYVGCHDGRCVGSNHVIENNHIHHLRGTSDGGNDGIEVKRGSYGNVIRNNVIHHTNIGTRYPCIFVYGGGPRPNTVEGNAVWECGEAIQVGADVVVRNNVIANSDVGISVAPHRQIPRTERVTITNNTLYGNRECLYVRWVGGRDLVLANNAFFCPGGRAVDARGLDESTARIRGNLVEGLVAGVALDGVRFAVGGPARAAFRDPAGADFWPQTGGPLIGAAAGELAPEADFNGTRRATRYDVGAYQSDGKPENPGWRITPGFKRP